MTFVSLVQLSFVFIICTQSDKMSVNTMQGAVSYVPFKAGVHQLPVSRTHWNPPLSVKAQLFLVTLWAEKRYMWPETMCTSSVLFLQSGWNVLTSPLSVEAHEASPGVSEARQENLWRQMKGKSVHGGPAQATGKFSVSKCNLLGSFFFFFLAFGFWTKFWEEGEVHAAFRMERAVVSKSRWMSSPQPQEKKGAT